MFSMNEKIVFPIATFVIVVGPRGKILQGEFISPSLRIISLSATIPILHIVYLRC